MKNLLSAVLFAILTLPCASWSAPAPVPAPAGKIAEAPFQADILSITKLAASVGKTGNCIAPGLDMEINALSVMFVFAGQQINADFMKPFSIDAAMNKGQFDFFLTANKAGSEVYEEKFKVGKLRGRVTEYSDVITAHSKVTTLAPRKNYCLMPRDKVDSNLLLKAVLYPGKVSRQDVLPALQGAPLFVSLLDLAMKDLEQAVFTVRKMRAPGTGEKLVRLALEGKIRNGSPLVQMLSSSPVSFPLYAFHGAEVICRVNIQTAGTAFLRPALSGYLKQEPSAQKYEAFLMKLYDSASGQAVFSAAGKGSSCMMKSVVKIKDGSFPALLAEVKKFDFTPFANIWRLRKGTMEQGGMIPDVFCLADPKKTDRLVFLTCPMKKEFFDTLLKEEVINPGIFAGQGAGDIFSFAVMPYLRANPVSASIRINGNTLTCTADLSENAPGFFGPLFTQPLFLKGNQGRNFNIPQIRIR